MQTKATVGSIMFINFFYGKHQTETIQTKLLIMNQLEDITDEDTDIPYT